MSTTEINHTYDPADHPISAADLLGRPDVAVIAAMKMRPDALDRMSIEAFIEELKPVTDALKQSHLDTRPASFDPDEHEMTVEEMVADGGQAHTTLQLDRDGAEWIMAYFLDERWSTIHENVASRLGVDLHEITGDARELVAELDEEFDDLLPERRGHGLDSGTPESGKQNVAFDRKAPERTGEPLITEVLERGAAATGPSSPEDPMHPRVVTLDEQLRDEYPAAVALRSEDGLSVSMDRREAKELWVYLNDDRWSEIERLGGSPFAEGARDVPGDAATRLVDPTSRMVLMKNIQRSFPARSDEDWQVNTDLYPRGEEILDPAHTNRAVGPTVRHFVGRDDASASDLLSERVETIEHMHDGHIDTLRERIQDDLKSQTDRGAELDLESLRASGITEAAQLRQDVTDRVKDTLADSVAGVDSADMDSMNSKWESMAERAVSTAAKWESGCQEAFESNQHARTTEPAHEPAPEPDQQPVWGRSVPFETAETQEPEAPAQEPPTPGWQPLVPMSSVRSADRDQTPAFTR